MTRKFARHNMTVPPGLVREVMRGGSSMLVVPVVMLNEQVLECSNCDPGGEYVSAQAIMESSIAWDNRPVTLSHPSEAWSPTNHQELEVGRLFNVHFEGISLLGEMWLDLAKLRKTDEGKTAEARFRAGEVTEVSTGYFADRTARNGRFNNTPYVAEHTGLIPDHLAILVNEIGACSIKGGCGAPRLNTQSQEAEDMDDEKKLLSRIAEFLMGTPAPDEESKNSDDDSSADDAAGPVENDSGDTTDSTNDDGDVVVENQDGSDQMDRKDLVARILNSGKAAGFDEAGLLAMSDDQFSTMATLAGCGCGGSEDVVENTDDNDTPVINSISAEDAAFVAELRNLSGGTADGLASLIEAGQNEAARRTELKTSLVASLVANAQVSMSEAILNGMTLEALEGFDRSINPTSYAGRGGPRIIENADEDGFAPSAPAVFSLSEEA